MMLTTLSQKIVILMYLTQSRSFGKMSTSMHKLRRKLLTKMDNRNQSQIERRLLITLVDVLNQVNSLRFLVLQVY